VPLASVERLGAIPDELCAALRGRFAEVGFDRRVLSIAAEGIAAVFEGLRFPLAHAILETRDDPGSRLAMLFTFAGAVPEESVRDALGRAACEALLAAGVLVPVAGALRSAYRVTPYEGLWIFTDHLVSGSDTVMVPGATTGRLIELMPSALTGGVLDLGCGHGLLALVAARRGAAPVIGTDINERAIALARFNARFNGMAAEFRVGDRTAPVLGHRFELVIAQPPYVALPADSVAATYMHGGALGDELALGFVGAIPPVLAEGGRALVCFDSAVRAGLSHAALVRDAMGAAPVDLVLLLEPGLPPEQQAIAYASVEAPDLGPTYAAAARRYHRHFQAVGVRAFHHVVAVLRRRVTDDEERTPITVSLSTQHLAGATSATLDALLESIDLAASPDEALLAAAVRSSPCTRWMDERPRPDARLEPRHAVRFGAGTVGTDRSFDEREYALLSALDGSDSVAHAIERFAAPAGTTADALRPDVLAFVRQALTTGLLEPRGTAGR
jgi:SAM-dependent methyltransferase